MSGENVAENMRVCRLAGSSATMRRSSRQRRTNPGDQYVSLKVVIGHPKDGELAEFIEKWAAGRPFDARRGMPS